MKPTRLNKARSLLSRRRAPREHLLGRPCLACGQPLRRGEETVEIHADTFHVHCALYRRPPAR